MDNFKNTIDRGPILEQIMLAQSFDPIASQYSISQSMLSLANESIDECINECIDEYQENTQIKGINYNKNEKIKIIKSDPLAYRYYINFLKKEKPKISHQSSSFSYLPIFKYIYESKNREFENEIIFKNEIYIGKPHGFYSIMFAFLPYKHAKKGFIDTIMSYDFIDEKNQIKNGVLKWDYSYFRYETVELVDFIRNIKYVAETIGSTLSVAQGSALINNNQKYVIMSDAEIEMGEFYENLLMQKKFNFNITLLIDYNGWSKQNQTIIEINDLKEMLEMFKQPAIIFDNRGFREYFEKEMK